MNRDIASAQKREKRWQEMAGRMASIANFMYHLVDARKLSDDDRDTVHDMYLEILEMLEFDEEIEG